MAGYEDVVGKVKGFFGDEKKTEEVKQKKYAIQRANEIMQKYSQAKNSKEDIRTRWIEFVKLWRGDHWKKNRAKWKSQTVENICHSIVETMIPLMGDRMPAMNFLPQTADDEGHAKKLNQASAHVWSSDDMGEKFPVILRDMLILGTSILKMRWDSEKYNGMGEITADVIDPFHFFPDPEATDPYTDMNWCILKTKMRKVDVKRIYGKDVPTDADYFSTEENRPTDTYMKKTTNYSSTSCTVIEYWELDENRQWKLSVVSNGELLDERLSPYEIDSHPFIFVYDHKLTGEFWGVGEFENLKHIQYELNKVRAMIMDKMLVHVKPRELLESPKVA